MKNKKPKKKKKTLNNFMPSKHCSGIIRIRNTESRIIKRQGCINTETVEQLYDEKYFEKNSQIHLR